MKRGILLICLAGGLAWSVGARADDSTNLINELRQAKDPAQRMLLFKKLHHRNHVAPPAMAMPGFPGAQAPAPQPADNAQPPAVPANPPLSDNAQANDASPDTADSGNPYASIVARNVFGLNPIPPPPPPDQPKGPPPPKITLTGIMTIFGPPEALFNVAGVKRGDAPPHDESYIFTEGEEQDDVEVTSIDTNKNEVTFNNHGTVQTIPLVEGTASSGSASSSPSWPGGQNFRMHRFGNNFGGGGPGNFQPSSFNNGQPQFDGNGNAGMNTPDGFNNFNNNPAGNIHNTNPNRLPGLANLSDDDQQALIAAQHAQLQQQNSPIAPLMPPTKYDNEAQQAAGGANGPAAPGPPMP